MMSFSTLPFLVFAQAAFWLAAARRKFPALPSEGRAAVLLWALLMLAWMATAFALGLSGAYFAAPLRDLFPLLWLPALPIFATMLLYRSSPAFAAAMQSIIGGWPRAFTLVQGLRVLAIGGLFKAAHGLMPQPFTWGVGIPDFMFGVSALVLAAYWPKRGWPPSMIATWSLTGFFIILLPGPVLAQLHIPGPLQLFHDAPDGTRLLEFPMVLAPTLVVPMFMTMNLMLALWAIKTHKLEQAK